jgi:hypothetical protein
MTHIAKVDLVFSISQKDNLVSNTSIDHRVNYFLAGRKVKKTILPTRHLRISSFLFIFSSFLFILFPLRAFCLASLLPHNVEFTVVRDFYCSLSIQLLQQTCTHGRGPPKPYHFGGVWFVAEPSLARISEPGSWWPGLCETMVVRLVACFCPAKLQMEVVWLAVR